MSRDWTPADQTKLGEYLRRELVVTIGQADRLLASIPDYAPGWRWHIARKRQEMVDMYEEAGGEAQWPVVAWWEW